MNKEKVIGRKVRHYRLMHSLTQQELAEKIGASASYIANIEQGQKGISVDKMVDISRFFKIGLSDLCPIEDQDGVFDKESLIGDIVALLRSWDVSQLKILKTMLAFPKN